MTAPRGALVAGAEATGGSEAEFRQGVMSNDEAMTYVAVIGAIVLCTVVLSVVAVRLRKATDAASLALRASDVVAQTRELLLGPSFVWAVWHKTTDVAAVQMLVRTHRDDVLSTVVSPTVVLDGVVQRFDLDGKHYEIRKPRVLTNRTHLYEVGRDEVLLSAEHSTFTTTFFRGDGASPLFTMSSGSALSRYRPLHAGDSEVGKLIVGLRQDSTVRILTLPEGRSSLLEQVFVLAS